MSKNNKKVISDDIENDEMIFRKKLDGIVGEIEVLSEKLYQGKQDPIHHTTKKSNIQKHTERHRHDHIKSSQDFDLEAEAILNEQTPFINQPTNVIAEMRDYQIECLNWLASLHKAKACGIVADEMGLGKTLETISFLAYLAESNPTLLYRSLIIVPKSTIINWKREFVKFCPSLRVITAYGAHEEERDHYLKYILPNHTFEAVITTAETLNKYLPKFKAVKWDYIIIDEAHKIKNINSLMSQNVRALRSDYRLLLTGTPIQNNLIELYALLNFIMPKMFKDSDDFDRIYNYLMVDTNNNYYIERLQQLIRPFIIRRLKAEVEKTLLPKMEKILFVGMSEMQIKWYKSLIARDYASLGITTNPSFMLMQLRKVCNHPYLFNNAEPQPYVDGEHIVNNSEKLRICDMLLRKLYSDGSKVLIFSQFTSVLDILQDYCVYRGYQWCRLDGQTSNEDRFRGIDAFQDPKGGKFIYLLSTKAGGLGINLTAADTVIIYDMDFNPQNDKQAEDRAHRIGQTKQVKIFKLVTTKSVDYKICERAVLKLKLDQMVIQSGRMAKGSTPALSKEEMKRIIDFGLLEIHDVSERKPQTIEEVLQESDNTYKEDIGKKVKKIEEQFQINENLNYEGINTFMWDGVDYRENNNKINEQINKIRKENLGNRREVNKKVKEQKKAGWRKEAGTIYDHQFWEEKELDDLDEKRLVQIDEYNDYDKKKRARLLDNEFAQINKSEFNRYITACAKYGRNDFTNIEKYCNIHKDVLKRYHDAFWNKEKYKLIVEYQKYITQVENGEKIIEQNEKIKHIFYWLCREDHAEFGLELNINGNTDLQNTEDKYLVLLTVKHEFDYAKVLMEIRSHFYLMFSFGLRFASEGVIRKRMKRVYDTYEKPYAENIEEYKKLLSYL